MKKLLDVIQEDILGNDNKYMAWAWITGVVIVFVIGFYVSSESVSFLGVADSRESQVNFEYPVEIKKIHVISGQAVKKGDLLVELNQSEMDSRIREINAQLGPLVAELKVRKKLNALVNNSEVESSADPLTSQINELENERNYLENQKKNLYVFSETSGVIGAVNFKKGEKAPSFAALLTVSPENPTYIQGFIHENLHSKLKIGNTVSVRSIANGTRLNGVVVSIGSRIVQMPERLMRVPTMPVWGREIVVEIPKSSGLLLGEKVQIEPKSGFLSFSTATASETKKVSEDNTYALPTPMETPTSLLSRYSIEPSGLTYLADVKKFLVISDDTDKEHTPILFLMDYDGKLDNQTIRIPELEKMTDIESISQVGNTIYLLSSQTQNKKGEERDSRQYFVRMNRNGLQFTNVKKIALKPLILKAAKKSEDKDIQDLLKKSDNELEIEGHVVEDGNLILALKRPTKGGKAFLISVGSVDRLFETEKLNYEDISVFTKIDFGTTQTNVHLISDMAIIGGKMFVSTVCYKEMCSAIWKVDQSGKKSTAELVQFYDGFKAEGIAVDPTGLLTVTFDQGSGARSFARISLKVQKKIDGNEK